MCTQAVGLVAAELERRGVSTVAIQLLRRVAEKVRPPRALWVSFEMGRPLGAPNDPAFQKKVLMALLKTLEAPKGPMIEDFPEDLPEITGEPAVLACPVNFAHDPVDSEEHRRRHGPE